MNAPEFVPRGSAILTCPEEKAIRSFNNSGVYSAVLAERDGKLRIVQEHQSTLPTPKK